MGRPGQHPGLALGQLTVTLSDLEAWLRRFATAIAENRDMLTELDAAIGDADHGTNMDRGMTAVLAALDVTPPDSPAALFKTVGMTLVSKVGGASGPLFGTLFLRMGPVLGADSEVTDACFAAALRAGLEGVVARGKAEAGDKTIYDALAPGLDALDAALSSGAPLDGALQAAADAASAGRDATTPMLARKGRASYLGERSIGHQDPGATSMALLFAAVAAGA